MSEQSFARDAEKLLRRRAVDILRDFPHEARARHWHPNGFAVFHLGEIAGLGRLRFHVWPRGLRVPLEGQPAIHSHPWALFSLVIVGCYKDIIYRVRRFDVDAPGRLRGFDIRFGPVDEGDYVYPIAAWYDVTISEERTVPEGHIHQVPAGVLHETPIDLDTCVATLLVTSVTTDPGKLLLIGDSAFGERTYKRPQISDAQLAYIVEDLKQMVASRP